MKQHIVLFFLVIACIGCILISCVKEIPFDEKEKQPLLVVNSIISPDSTIKVYVSKTAPILSNENRGISNATVSLYENGVFVDNLLHTDSNLYMLNKYPEIGSQYELRITTPQIQAVSTSEKIPEKTEISSCYLKGPFNGPDPDGGGISILCEVNITFKDDESSNNYYEILLFSVQGQEVNYVYPNRINLSFPILKNEGDIDYEPSSIFFSDELFNGREVSLQFNISHGWPIDELYVFLRTTSYNYYKYTKLWTRHYHNQSHPISNIYDLFAGESIDMFTNIKNGYGIFAGYSQDIKSAVIIPFEK